MQSYRLLSRISAIQTKRTLLNPITTRKMSLFPRSFIASDPSTSFTPLFRLLDDFDSYNKSTDKHHSRSGMKSFSPKFDVKEVGDVYELHGELPGIEQKDVEIEFSDAQTITVKGHTEHYRASGNPPQGQGAIEGSKNHQPTVEDVDNPQDSQATREVTKHEPEKSKDNEAKYWVSERSVGEFMRSFTFPVRVDQDNVRATMKNGILSVTVPKAKKVESRKITIA